MPIYEYQCRVCDRLFERIMKVDKADPPCPGRGAGKVHKQAAPFRTNAWSSFLDRMEKQVNPRKIK